MTSPRTPDALTPTRAISVDQGEGTGAPLPLRNAPLLPRKGKSPLPLAVASAGMLARPVRVRASDVVFVKGLLEASEGLAVLFAERGGDLVIAAPEGRERDLAELLADLEAEIGLQPGAPTALVDLGLAPGGTQEA